MLVTIVRNRISVKRQTTEAKQGNVAASVITFPAPSQASTVLLELNNADTGSVLITGTDKNDGAQTETLTFTSSKIAQSVKVFKTVTQLDFTDLAGNYFYARFRGRDGSSVKVQSTVYTCINAQISPSRQSWPNDRSGTVQSGNMKILVPLYCMDEANVIQSGDLLTDLDSSQVFMATGNILFEGIGINRYQVIYAERRERT